MKKIIVELLKYLGINKYAINLEKNKQQFSQLIYSHKFIQLKILKTYIKTNLINSFIKLLKFPVKAFILFVRKSYNSFCLCINYQALYNLIIIN